MQTANSQNTTELAYTLRETFGNFCVIIFNARESIKKEKENVDYKAVHRSMNSFIKVALESEKHLLPHYSEVVYVMAALADDIFLNMEWEGKQFWEDNILEQKFFSSQIAGDEIFNRINKLLEEKDDFASVEAEIYLKMLALGFEGKYRGAEDESTQINIFRDKLLDFMEKLDNSLLMVGYRLFQKEYTHTIPTIHRKMLPEASIINYMCAFFVFMFLSISSIVWMYETKDISRLLSEISYIALRE
ncbi:MAG: DotU family type IV/VI secretion system protein [Alphaproteobacteria bacterium]|nr:DotU family type IV/VI secretion system protein [Alphaproteobacteria bacterium]